MTFHDARSMCSMRFGSKSGCSVARAPSCRKAAHAVQSWSTPGLELVARTSAQMCTVHLQRISLLSARGDATSLSGVARRGPVCCTPIVDWGRNITTALSQVAMLHTTEARFHHMSPDSWVPEPKVCARM